jgi:hypothetical protein
MPYKGVESFWAYAAMIADQYFVIVVPKSEIMTLPEEVGQMFVGYSKKQTAITGVSVLLAIFFVGIVALGFDDSIEYDSFHRCIEPGQVIVIGTDGI